ncbi:MAG: hypothetical protein KAG84_06910 [Bacteroidales bacterium]|nr:hypothetical protein [Bacteroidales bacterium]
MKELLTIKNYIYGKGIMSKLYENPIHLLGIHKGKQFKIYITKSKNIRGGKKNPPQIVVDKAGKLFYAKHSRNIPDILG